MLAFTRIYWVATTALCQQRLQRSQNYKGHSYAQYVSLTCPLDVLYTTRGLFFVSTFVAPSINCSLLLFCTNSCSLKHRTAKKHSTYHVRRGLQAKRFRMHTCILGYSPGLYGTELEAPLVHSLTQKPSFGVLR